MSIPDPKVNINTESRQNLNQKESSPPPPATGSVLDALNFTNSLLAILIVYVLYRLFGSKKRIEERERFILPDPLPKHDMTLEELRQYDGKGPDKRICIAILGQVFDCTKGYDYYGPGGAYSTFAGRDASRALAKFDVLAVKDEWDDISDLDLSEMSSVREWNEQFREKYDLVGRLVRSKEEILEKPDFDENLSSNKPNILETNQTSNGKSSTDDDEIEVIKSDESSNEATTPAAATNTSISNKKVSFIDVPEQKSTKSSDSSDDIEVLDN